jgi:hypothetical protein
VRVRPDERRLSQACDFHRRHGHGPPEGVGGTQLAATTNGLGSPCVLGPRGILSSLHQGVRRHHRSSHSPATQGFLSLGCQSRVNVPRPPARSHNSAHSPAIGLRRALHRGVRHARGGHRRSASLGAWADRILQPPARTVALRTRSIGAGTYWARDHRVPVEALPMGWSFLIHTDHYNLKFLLDQKLATIPQHQWVSNLLGFDFHVEYKPSIANVVANALSRRDLETEPSILALSVPSFELFEDLQHAFTSDLALRSLRDKVEWGGGTWRQLAHHEWPGYHRWPRLHPRRLVVD